MSSRARRYRGRRARARQSRKRVSPSSSTVGSDSPKSTGSTDADTTNTQQQNDDNTPAKGSATQGADDDDVDETKVRCEAITKVGNRCQYTSCCDVVLDDGTVKRGCVHHKTKVSFNKELEEKRLLTAAKRKLRKQRKQRIADEGASDNSARDNTSHSANSSGEDADGGKSDSGGSNEQNSDKEYSKIVKVKRRKKKYYEATKYQCSVCGKSGHTRPTCPEIQIFLESRHLRKTLSQKNKKRKRKPRQKKKKEDAGKPSSSKESTKNKDVLENAAANPVEKDGATHIKTSDTKNQNMTEDNTGSDGRFSEAANTEDVEVNSNTSAESPSKKRPRLASKTSASSDAEASRNSNDQETYQSQVQKGARLDGQQGKSVDNSVTSEMHDGDLESEASVTDWTGSGNKDMSDIDGSAFYSKADQGNIVHKHSSEVMNSTYQQRHSVATGTEEAPEQPQKLDRSAAVQMYQDNNSNPPFRASDASKQNVMWPGDTRQRRLGVTIGYSEGVPVDMKDYEHLKTTCEMLKSQVVLAGVTLESKDNEINRLKADLDRASRFLYECQQEYQRLLQTVRGQHSQQNYLISRDMHNTRMYSNIDSPRYQNRGIPPANEMPNFSGNGEYRNLDSNSQFYGSSRVAGNSFSPSVRHDNSKIINTTITSNGSSNNANMMKTDTLNVPKMDGDNPERIRSFNNNNNMGTERGHNNNNTSMPLGAMLSQPRRHNNVNLGSPYYTRDNENRRSDNPNLDYQYQNRDENHYQENNNRLYQNPSDGGYQRTPPPNSQQQQQQQHHQQQQQQQPQKPQTQQQQYGKTEQFISF